MLYKYELQYFSFLIDFCINFRLDLVMMILFHATPLESTDGERLGKIARCKHRILCVNPSHICIVAKELDLFLSNYLPQRGTLLFSCKHARKKFRIKKCANRHIFTLLCKKLRHRRKRRQISHKYWVLYVIDHFLKSVCLPKTKKSWNNRRRFPLRKATVFIFLYFENIFKWGHI